MTSLFSVLGARIFRQRFSIRCSRSVVPVHGIYGTARIVRKCEITNGIPTLCNFCTSSTFRHRSKCDTVSSSPESVTKDYVKKECTVDSSEQHEHKATEDEQGLVPTIERIYNDVMTVPKWLTYDEWSAVGAKQSLGSSRLASHWPTSLLHYIAQKNEAIPGVYDVGMSLVDYVACLSDRHRLLRLVSAVALYVHQGTADDHEKALSLYDELCAEYDVFDHVSAYILIAALARTRYWRHCMELIEQVKITASPGSKEYSPVIVAAMVNRDSDLASELLTTLSRMGLMPDDKVFMHILASGSAEQLLAVLRDFAWIPSRPVVEALVTQLQRYIVNC